MTQYIDKADVVAQANIEITNLRIAEKEGFLTEYGRGMLEGLEGIVDFLDTLEVKEVDLEKAIDGLTAGWIEGEEYGELQNVNTFRCVTLEEVKEVMRCMFGLGLKAQKGE